MNIFPRFSRDVTPLSPGVEAMLRGLPRVEAAANFRMQLLAAHARGDAAREMPSSAIAAWLRLAVPASAAAAAVLAIGVGAGAPSTDAGSQASQVASGSMIAMVAHGDMRAPATVAMRVIDDPSIPMAAGSGRLPVALNAWSADGHAGLLDGP